MYFHLQNDKLPTMRIIFLGKFEEKEVIGMWKKLFAAGGIGLMLFGGVANAAAGDTNGQAYPEKIVINLASRSLALYKGDEKLKLYPIGPGKASTPTPVGYYKILSKEINPTWIDPGDERNVIPSGKNNPLGYRWMQIYGNYGIHGTNKPESIGKFVSNGCIRMFENDVETLFDLVRVGTPVEITYNRVVVEKIPDNSVVYYVYPDGYGRQPLNKESVMKWLRPFGVTDFVSEDLLAAKIRIADGQPTYVGKSYNIRVNGKVLQGKAVKIDDLMYLPVTEIAATLNLPVEVKKEEGTLQTDFGEAVYYNKKNNLYINADDARALLAVDGGVTRGGIYDLASVAKTPSEETPTARVGAIAENTETNDGNIATNVDNPADKESNVDAEKVKAKEDKKSKIEIHVAGDKDAKEGKARIKNKQQRVN